MRTKTICENSSERLNDSLNRELSHIADDNIIDIKLSTHGDGRYYAMYVAMIVYKEPDQKPNTKNSDLYIEVRCPYCGTVTHVTHRYFSEGPSFIRCPSCDSNFVAK